MFNPCISLERSVTPIFLYYIFVLLYVLHVILENNKKLFLEFQLFYYFRRMIPKKPDVWEDVKEMFSPKNARQWFLIHYNAMFSHT